MPTAQDAVPAGRPLGVPDPDGLVLRPFRALRYAGRTGPALASVTTPPYDVLDAEAVRRYEDLDPHSVVRLILPRDEPGRPESRYPRAARTLADWRDAGILQPDAAAGLYVYEEAEPDHVQRGLVGGVGLARPETGIVLPHENTMGAPVADRLALMTSTATNLEPILLVYDGGGVASEVVADAASREPLAQAETEDGIRHTLWALVDAPTLRAVAEDLQPRRAMIADGHHRYATYLRYQADRWAEGAGPGPWDSGLAMLVDATAFGPKVSAIHRVIAGLALDDAVRQAAGAFRTTEVPAEDALAALADAGKTGCAFLLAGKGRFVLLSEPDPAAVDAALPAGRSSAWRELDVTVAHGLLVTRLWGLPDREDVVGFAHDVEEALAAAAAQDGTALLLNPTPVAAVSAVATAGERMPRKSTLFTPKPRSGIVLRAFADQ